MNRRHNGWDVLAAFTVAYFLVLQSVLGTFAFAIGPGASQVDAFGNVICTHEGAREGPSDLPQQKHVPACCALGCKLVASVSFTPPVNDRFLAEHSYYIVAFVLPTSVHLDFERPRSPSEPRAPPVVT